MIETPKRCCANCHYYWDGCTYMYDQNKVVYYILQPYKETNCEYYKERMK